MDITGYTLRSAADFDNAIWMGRHIELWQRGECVHRGGIIEFQTSNWVKIDGVIYMKYCYEFRCLDINTVGPIG